MAISTAANNLAGRKLKSGWEVIEKVDNSNTTGGCFSICYKVIKMCENGKTDKCFMKVFDILSFIQRGSNKSLVDAIEESVRAFKYESLISNVCRGKKLSKVVYAKESHEEKIDGFDLPDISYLVFDYAKKGDIRTNFNHISKTEIAWKIRSINHIVIGLRQLHANQISHQDIKPSNILLFEDESKVADLGRSQSETYDSPNRTFYSGDKHYIPPEFLLGSYDKENWEVRAYSTDLYLLGSLIVYYFTGLAFNTKLVSFLPQNIRSILQITSIDQTMANDLIQNAYVETIAWFEKELTKHIDNHMLVTELKQIVEQLCHPDYKKRGHPKTLLYKHGKYSLERYVSWVNRLYKKASIEMR